MPRYSIPAQAGSPLEEFKSILTKRKDIKSWLVTGTSVEIEVEKSIKELETDEAKAKGVLKLE